MPVMYWFMNAYNEFVGNTAVGVHGFGSCYWLLGSGVSGHSFEIGRLRRPGQLQRRGDRYQAPLLRFRGNSCMTAPLALPASAEMPAGGAAIAAGQAIGYHAVPNPYLAGKALDRRSQGTIQRPAVNGDFKPIQPNVPDRSARAATNCAHSRIRQIHDAAQHADLRHHRRRPLHTSFNWAEVNFGSIWFRPWYYLFLNSAMTDQLFGGLDLRHRRQLDAGPAGLLLARQEQPVRRHFAVRSQRQSRTPNAPGRFQDLERARTPCSRRLPTVRRRPATSPPKAPATGANSSRSGSSPSTTGRISPTATRSQRRRRGHAIHSRVRARSNCEQSSSAASTARHPAAVVTDSKGRIDKTKTMTVIDAAIGWKQPNGFYYPPAFAYRKSSFVKTLSHDAGGRQRPEQCFSFAKKTTTTSAALAARWKLPSQRHRSHAALYQRQPDLAQRRAADLRTRRDRCAPVTPVDFSTILLDVDGSLTGATGSLSGEIVETSSISRNQFFDAPSPSPECLSFGLQTSPFQFVTTMIATLVVSPANGDTTCSRGRRSSARTVTTTICAHARAIASADAFPNAESRVQLAANPDLSPVALPGRADAVRLDLLRLEPEAIRLRPGRTRLVPMSVTRRI